MDSENFFARALRQRREEAGVTQQDLAQAMSDRGFSFHQATVYKVERGERKVSIGEALAFASILNIELGALLPNENPAERAARRDVMHLGTNIADAYGDIVHWLREVVSQQEALQMRLDTYLAQFGAELTVEIGGDRKVAREWFRGVLGWKQASEFYERITSLRDGPDGPMTIESSPKGDIR